MAKNFDEELTGGRRVRGKDDIAIRAVGYILIGLFALICVIPFYLIIVASFTDEASLIRNGYPLIPTDFSVESYRLSLKNSNKHPDGIRCNNRSNILWNITGCFCWHP